VTCNRRNMNIRFLKFRAVYSGETVNTRCVKRDETLQTFSCSLDIKYNGKSDILFNPTVFSLEFVLSPSCSSFAFASPDGCRVYFLSHFLLTLICLYMCYVLPRNLISEQILDYHVHVSCPGISDQSWLDFSCIYVQLVMYLIFWFYVIAMHPLMFFIFRCNYGNPIFPTLV
jgi:hypothetical protein